MFSNPDAKEEDFQQVVHLCGIDKFANKNLFEKVAGIWQPKFVVA